MIILIPDPFSVILAETVPYLGTFISLVGSFFGTYLSLILPPVLELILKRNNKRNFGFYVMWTKNIIIMMTGVLGSVCGTVISISDVISQIRIDMKN